MTSESERIIWPYDEMIAATLEAWGDEGIDPDDCVVVEDDGCDGGPCLVVLHGPTGRTSAEAGDAGRWNRDGTARGY